MLVSMNSVLQWLTSQSGVSLLVALIALFGVVVATWWNNKAADKRRRDDQTVADKRRRDDQAAEDARRKADDARRERERLEQLQREDWARQRRAVADCLREITKGSALVFERAAGVHLHDNGTPEHSKLVKAVELAHFYVEASNQMTLLDIEISQPRVSAQVKVLWEQLTSDFRPLSDALNRGGQEWINQAEGMPALSDLAVHEIKVLANVARSALLEHPELMETRPVKPIDLEEYHRNEHDGPTA